jgi:hypothetical protein
MHLRRDERLQLICESCVRPRLEACQPLAETFGVHEDSLMWRTRGLLRSSWFEFDVCIFSLKVMAQVQTYNPDCERSKFSTLLIVILLWVKVCRQAG